jgi:mono/diheme cytochrome c family protein
MVSALGVLLAGGAARADRNARGNTIYVDRCAHCHHDSAQLRTEIARDKMVGRGANDALAAWLANPVAVNASTLCRAGVLDAAQRDTLHAFLRSTTNPVRRERSALKVPAERHRGVVPAPPPPEPKLGQGDHR